VDYFERLSEKQASQSSTMAQFALLEKAVLQLGQKRRSDAMQTLQRITQMPGSDPLISTRVQALEKAAGKG
jgi:hypothetical protein